MHSSYIIFGSALVQANLVCKAWTNIHSQRKVVAHKLLAEIFLLLMLGMMLMTGVWKGKAGMEQA